MSSGILGSYDLIAGVSQAIYVSDKTGGTVLTVNLCNRNSFSTTIRVAISSSQTSPLSSDWIEYDTPLPANAVLERSALIIPPGKYLVVRSVFGGISAVCWGGTLGDDFAVTPITVQTGSLVVWATPAGSVADISSTGSVDVSLAASDPDGGAVSYSVTSGTLPTGVTLSTTTGKLAGTLSGSYGGTNPEVTSFTVSATDGYYTVPRTFSITRRWNDGSSSALAALSAADIKTITSTNTDGTYWINLPTVGPTQIYCVMNSSMSGGGWMMMMKATRGTTFPWSSSYWTSNNTLNPSATNRNDGDAKFNTMNYFAAKDVMALWPDLSNGGDVSGQSYGTVWIENNWYSGGTRIVPITFFNTVNNYNPNSLSVRNTKWNGGSQFSSQSGAQAYGFNLTYNSGWSVRWGWQWNNEGDWSSNDVGGGIGMNNTSYSAGDYIACCNDVGGFNRTARVEMYVR